MKIYGSGSCGSLCRVSQSLMKKMQSRQRLKYISYQAYDNFSMTFELTTFVKETERECIT